MKNKTLQKRIEYRRLQELVLEKKRVELQKKCIDNYYTFFRTFWDVVSPDAYQGNWHIPAICGVLQKNGERLARKEPKDKDIVINLPPGESKSTMVTVLWPVWLWLKNPSLSIISSSYSYGLSVELSRKSKDVIKSDNFQFLFGDYFVKKFGKELRLTKDSETLWENNYGGLRIATSTGGTITGKHGDLILRDDPINPEQAESEAYRTRALRFNNKTLSMRKRDKKVTLTVTIMQRLHQNDQTGYELKNNRESIYHVCLPAELSDNVRPKEWRKHYKNGLLDEKRLPRKVLDESRKVLGGLGYSGQMQQSPTTPGGNILKKRWFYTIPAPPEGMLWDMFLDTAYTEKTKNDPTGFLVVGYDIAGRRIIVQWFGSEYLEMPALLKRIPVVMEQNQCSPASMVYVEPKASGKSVKQMIRANTLINITEIKNKLVQASKTERANYIAPFAESGRIALVEGNWNEAFLDELAGFPTADHDESIDLLAYACRKYLHR